LKSSQRGGDIGSCKVGAKYEEMVGELEERVILKKRQ
jgi:hypothetical protein